MLKKILCATGIILMLTGLAQYENAIDLLPARMAHLCRSSHKFYKDGLIYCRDRASLFVATITKWYENDPVQTEEMIKNDRLGRIAAKSLEVVPDSSSKLEALEKAARRGNAEAQWRLGVMFRHGQGVEQSRTKAREWWEKAAAQGHAHAQFRMGVIYEGERNYTKARDMYEKAAAQGHAVAQYNLGGLYSYPPGSEIAQNMVLAKEWFGKACDNGDRPGCENYHRLNEAGF